MDRFIKTSAFIAFSFCLYHGFVNDPALLAHSIFPVMLVAIIVISWQVTGSLLSKNKPSESDIDIDKVLVKARSKL